MSHDYEEFRRKTIADGMNKIKKKFPQNNDPILSKLEQTIEVAKKIITPVVKAGGAVHKRDRNEGLRPMILACLLQQFDTYTKEELMQLTSVIIGERLMQDVEDNPYGKDNPDLLSGK